MMCGPVTGTEGYADGAEALVEQWQRISFAEQHAPVRHLLPTKPCRVVDIGAGIGVDASAFAAMGHSVVAVEPVREFRQAGMALHPSPGIQWLDDHLPELAVLLGRGGTFDTVMLTAVWMHLDEVQRRHAMPRIAALMSDSGIMIMSLRHGPVPPGRRMYEVSGEETMRLAAAQGLRPVLNLRTPSLQDVNRRLGVFWTRLAFAKAVVSTAPRSAPVL